MQKRAEVLRKLRYLNKVFFASVVKILLRSIVLKLKMLETLQNFNKKKKWKALIVFHKHETLYAHTLVTFYDTFKWPLNW